VIAGHFRRDRAESLAQDARRGSTEPTLLVLDLGLTHAKAVIFGGVSGDLIDRASRPITTSRPTPETVEQDPEGWWAGLRDAVAELRGRRLEALEHVAGIGVTAQMHALVCVRADGTWLGPALVLGDRRAASHSRAIEDEVGADRIYRITGARMDASMPAAKARWLHEHDWPRHHETALYTSAKDAIRGRLTGDRLSEPIDACATSLWDIHARGWSGDLLAATGLSTAALPEVVPPWSVAGPLLSQAASDLGLTTGTPVIVGAGDDIEVLGCGLTEPGTAVEHLGTTGSIFVVTGDGAGDPEMALEVYPHALPDRWVLGGSTTTAGSAIAWVADLMGEAGPGALFASLDDEGQRTDASFLASLAGDRCPVRDPLARGAIVGLDLRADRVTVALAAFDGVNRALARIFERIDQVAGPVARLVISSGDLGADERWMRRRAARYERPMSLLPGSEPTATGVAILVATGIGLAVDIPDAIERFVPPARLEIGPDEHGGDPGDRHASDLRLDALARDLRPVWPMIGRLTGPQARP
jgi:xylulokinase